MADLLSEAGEEQVGSHRGEAALLTETTKLRMCQVRSKTDNPCLRPAAMKIWGIPFCERCAREQEAYFAVGKLTQEQEMRDLHDEPFIEVLGRMR